jgi:hypothetical protein
MRVWTFSSLGIAAIVCVSAVVFPAACVQLDQPGESLKEESLVRFLRDYVTRKHFEDDKETRYSHAFIDLNGDGRQEAIVYLQGRWWCGTGGCPTLVLEPTGDSFRVVASILATRPPIRVLTEKSNGWRDISVWVQGGSPQPGYEAELRFDGKTYHNPPYPPHRRSPGEVVIASQTGMLLFRP